MTPPPWHKVVEPRKEVREGRSFDPAEFAIALEQVVAGTAPEDYRDPVKFFARTCFTAALNHHLGMVLRRLAGQTADTAPVLSLITQFGGGKTHTLTALYHLASNPEQAGKCPGVADLLRLSGLHSVPQTRVAVFVGNAWDPRDGFETPWIDIARQLAGDAGVEALGTDRLLSPPGTDTLLRVFQSAGGSVLVLFDEVLNFVSRHRGLAEPFQAFIQNLTVAMTGATLSAAVISLPRSLVEMTDWDYQWQQRITKVVQRVAKDLIANDEAEIAEVVRRRLFEDLGKETVRREVARAFAEWCFLRRAQLPSEWTAVDTALNESKAVEHLTRRFEACYPFHPATLSVFQRKWGALPQYQQTRGTLAMLAQWVSWSFGDNFTHARREPLITLGSAPLDNNEFRAVVLGQIGEERLGAAIAADISGEMAHARVLDIDTKDALQDIHRRVGAAIFFESCGGQVDKVAYLPELRFALGEPGLDTTSIDNAALALESKAFFIRRVGSDGFRIYHQPTLRKVISDRRASIDEEEQTIPKMKQITREEFNRGDRRRTLVVSWFPTTGAEVADTPKLTLLVMSPTIEWDDSAKLRAQVAEWTKRKDKTDRLYPAALVWCFKKPGRELLDKTEDWLAHQLVKKEIEDGSLGHEFDGAELSQFHSKCRQAEEEARDEVWASYRFIVLADKQEEDGLKVIDLGAGHASSGDTLCGRVVEALKSHSLLNETIGAGYLERNWPQAHQASGAWPLSGLRQSMLDGSLTRLLDPDAVLKGKIPQFVEKGELGLASGLRPDGTFEHVWFKEYLSPDEVMFEPGVFLLKKSRAQELKDAERTPVTPTPQPQPPPGPTPAPEPGTEPEPPSTPLPQPGQAQQLRLAGLIPPEVWNRLGTTVIPKLKAQGTLSVKIELSATVSPDAAASLSDELKQLLDELGIGGSVGVEVS